MQLIMRSFFPESKIVCFVMFWNFSAVIAKSGSEDIRPYIIRTRTFKIGIATSNKVMLSEFFRIAHGINSIVFSIFICGFYTHYIHLFGSLVVISKTFSEQKTII